MSTRHAQPITITVPLKLLATVDKLAKEEGHTRSGFFREALRALIWKRRWEAVQTYGSQKAKEKGVTEDQVDNWVHELRRKA